MDSRKKKRGDFDEEEAVVAGDISVLSEEILQEILLRLPPSSLLNSISASRYLLRVCSSPLFRLHYKSRRASYLLGFFVNEEIRQYIPISSSSTAVSESVSGYIIDSRGVWLLLEDFNDFSVRLFHPIFNETVAMVQPSFHKGTFCFCAALLPDPSSSNPRCRVRILLVLTKQPSFFPIIQIFSPGTPGEWKNIQSSSKIHIGHRFVIGHSVLVNEFVHWLKGDCQILVLNENSYDLSLLGLPRGVPMGLPGRITNHRLGKLKNRLCYAYLEESELYIWVLVDRLRCEWRLEHRLEVGKFPELGSHSDETRFLAIGIGGRLTAIFQGLMGKIFSLGLVSGELREISNADFEFQFVFPYISMEAD